MIRTPSHKWFVSHKKQLVTLRVCLPKVPLHLVDLQVEPTHVSLNTFRFSRKYQLFVKLPEGYDLDPNRAYAVPTDKNYILINVPFSETKEPQSVEGNLLQSTAPTGIAEEATAEGNLDEKKQNRKMREESKEIPKEKPRQLLKKDKENIPFLMERMSSFRSLYVAFQRRLERDIPSIWKRKRILISVRGYFFKYLRGDLSLSELKQLVYRRNDKISRALQQMHNEENSVQKEPELRIDSTKDMLRKVAEEIGTKVEKLQQSKNEKEQEAASLFQFRQYKRDLRRERRRNKRKLAKKLAHQKVSKAYEENSANPQRKTRQPVVRFSTET